MERDRGIGAGLSRRQVLARGGAFAGTLVASSLLAACGGSSSSGRTTTAAAGALRRRTLNRTVRLTYWTHAWPAPGAGAEELVAAFKKAEPRIDLTVKQYPYPDFVTALRTGVPNGTAGDVLGLETGSMMRQYASFLEPIEERVTREWGAGWEADFMPTSIEEIRGSVPDERTLYALPQQFSVGAVMFYNRALFARAGVEVPTSYDELRDVTQRLTAQNVIPIAWGAKDQWENTDYLISFAAMWRPGVIEAAERGTVSFTDPAIVDALSFMHQTVEDGIWNRAPFATTSFPEAFGTFTGGKAAMASIGTWGLNLFRPEQFRDLGVFLFPHVEGAPDASGSPDPSGVPATAGPGTALPWKTDNVTMAVRSGLDADTAEAGFRFISYWCGPEGQRVGARFFAPARRDVPNPLVVPDFEPQFEWMQSLAGAAQVRQFLYPETRVAVQDAIAEVCTRGVSAEEALERVQTTAERARRRAA